LLWLLSSSTQIFGFRRKRFYALRVSNPVDLIEKFILIEL